ncbi:NAD(P)/FAD-dependent oxidoreductase [Amycolatopsis saalfeldensis]|uniref:Glycine/D-amino acid oxidase n=1 Tax=Amycolatopsis saalfeldensis TaxID=394193 RepID=A0A1H8YM48_9PSEU|nr:FAD-dependent oxidoreductase [Amycolatopsis saalfeldensis]SEP53122.1 Glycine/D-amino acid oxidase [Amycolatopsis saalfeldensis]
MNTTASLRDVLFEPFWLQDPGRPRPRPALVADTSADLVVVGGGYSGLWSALLAKERDPARDVVLLEGNRIGWAASGRNGGFCSSSLTHGLPNGDRRWPGELALLERLGAENLQGIEDTLARYGIDCDWRRSGEITVATDPHQIAQLHHTAELAARCGKKMEVLDGARVRAEVHSPTYLAGVSDPDGVALVHPAKLAWGLAEACERLGVRIFESSPVTALDHDDRGVTARTGFGTVLARNAVLGTNAFRSPLRRVRPYTIPVYDYALMTEPLSEAQQAAIGWEGRQGLADTGSKFHYYRMTADHRILWGGYDAVYHYRGRVRAEHDTRPRTLRSLAANFFRTFPQLEGLRFSHAWGGAIDTCTRFSAFYGTAARGKVAYAAGHTGLGVGATRFAADVMLDLLSGVPTERTRTTMVTTKPMPFPPEPLRWTGVRLTQLALARADRRGGRRNLWLKAMDRVGFGFDS